MLTSQAELVRKLSELRMDGELPVTKRAFGQLFGENGMLDGRAYGAAIAFARMHGCTLSYEEYDASSSVVFRKTASGTTNS